jgi:tetratricopeptide (TPR) repeat protein
MKKIVKKGIIAQCFLLFIFLLLSFSVLANTDIDIQLEDLLQSIIEEKTNIEDAYTFINVGNFFMHQELYQQAQEEYRKALEVDPSNKMAKVNLSYALFKSEEHKLALDILNELTEDDTANAYAYYIKGLIYKNQRDLDNAIEQYEKVIELIPNHQQLNAELGQLYLDNHELIKANERFTEMGYSQPRPQIMDKLIAYQVNAYCFLHLGNYYRENNEIEKAQQAYQTATQFEDDKRSIALAYFYKGEIELKEHNYDQAIIEKKLAQRIYPLGDHNFTFDTFAEAFVEIGDMYYHEANLPEAMKNYELASNMASAQDILALAHYKKGLTYYRSQDYKNALREAEIALSLNPDYLADRQRLIDLLIANSWSKITEK